MSKTPVENEQPEKPLSEEHLLKIYPSAELAFPLAVASYETAQKRLEALEKRLQDFMAFIIAVTFALITVFAGKNYNFKSGWFIAAMLCALCSVLIGLYIRFAGTLLLINPTVLYRKHITTAPTEFRRSFIFFAGKHWTANNEWIIYKAKLLMFVAFFFVAELILLGIWMVQVPGLAAATTAAAP